MIGAGAAAVAALAGASTLILSLGLPPLLRPLLERLGIMDVPNERSSHVRPVLRGMGLAVLIAMAAGGALGAWGLSASGQSGTAILLVAVLAGLASGLRGLAEDLRGLSVPLRSALQIGIALASSIAIVALTGMTWWLVIYAVLFVSSYINVANFMDGLNGISGLHGVVAGLTFAAAGWLGGFAWLLVAGLVLAAGFAGFLPWNLFGRGAFLGDVGSYLLGGATAVTSMAAFAAGVPILASIGPMILYFGDVGTTLVRRTREGKKWDEPHKEHVYQRIQQLGYSHLAASGMTAGLSAVASILGLVSFFVPPIWWLALTAAGLAVLALYLALPKILPARHARVA